MQVGRGLDVDGDGVRARLGDVRDVAVGPLHHHVDVQDAAGAVDQIGQRGDDHGPEGDRRDEMAVHHIDVDDPSARVEHVLHLGAEPGEVGRQD